MQAQHDLSKGLLILKFQDAESTAGLSVCPTEGDEAAILAQAAADASQRASQLSGQRFIDNGDLTVTDTLTGLQWEQKTTDASVHNAVAVYSLSDVRARPTSPTVISRAQRAMTVGRSANALASP